MDVQTSVIVPWCNRDELPRTLSSNESAFTRHGAEVIIANVGGDQATLMNTLPRVSFPLRCIHLPHPYFNKALAVNLGFSQSRGNRILILDSDTILQDDDLLTPYDDEHYAARASRTIVESAWKEHTDNISGYALEVRNIAEFIFRDKSVSVQIRSNAFNPRARSGPGNVCLAARRFKAVDGMTSALSGWGWEDIDLLLRVQMFTGLPTEYSGKALHLSHGNEKRYFIGDNPADNDMRNQKVAMERYNSGNFSGTLQADHTRYGHEMRGADL